MTPAEVLWTSFLGIINLDRKNEILSHKDCLGQNRNMAPKVLARGILKTDSKIF